jgi:hypothetical protein
MPIFPKVPILPKVPISRFVWAFEVFIKNYFEWRYFLRLNFPNLLFGIFVWHILRILVINFIWTDCWILYKLKKNFKLWRHFEQLHAYAFSIFERTIFFLFPYRKKLSAISLYGLRRPHGHFYHDWFLAKNFSKCEQSIIDHILKRPESGLPTPMIWQFLSGRLSHMLFLGNFAL